MGGLGDFRIGGGDGAFSVIWQGSEGVFEGHPGTPVPSAPDFSPFLRAEGKPLKTCPTHLSSEISPNPFCPPPKHPPDAVVKHTVIKNLPTFTFQKTAIV